MKFQPHVSVDHRGRVNPEGARKIREIDVHLHILRMSPHRSQILSSSLELLKSIKMIRKLKIYIQHSFDYSCWWLEPILAKLGGVRYWISTKTNVECDGLNWLLRMKFADYVVAQSPYMAKLLIEKFPFAGSKIWIVPNGVDTTKFIPKEKNNANSNDLHPNWGSIVLGCVAHLAPYKDHPNLLRAFARAKNRDIQLLLIGRTIDLEYEKNIKDLINELGIGDRVHGLGLRGDLDQIYPRMDGVILTSKGDSLSNAILEGMSCGLPVISSDVGGMRDIVREGVNGWLVARDEHFIESLSHAIDEWAGNAEKRRAYGRASRKIVEEEYSLEQMVQGYISLYEALISGNLEENVLKKCVWET